MTAPTISSIWFSTWRHYGHRTHSIDWTCSALFSIAQRTTCEALLQPLGCAPKGTHVLLCGVPVHLGTAPFSAGPYTRNMQLESIEATAVTVLVWNNPRRTKSETIQEVRR
jgi:hypothetical protein